MKKIIRISMIVLAVLLILVLAKNLIAKVAIENGTKMVTGLQLKMDKFDFSLIKNSVEIKGLKLFNPDDFKDRIMVDLPQIFVDYRLGALFENKVHLESMIIDLKQLTVVKNADGELNLDALKTVQEEKQKPEKVSGASKEKTEPEKKKEAMKIQIDLLTLRIGKVVYKDYSKGGEPSVKEFNINFDQSFENIMDPNTLVSLILVKALAKTSIPQLANFDMDNLKGVANEAVAASKEKMMEAAEKAGDLLEEHGDEVWEKTEEFTKTQSKATLDKAKSWFGSAKEKLSGSQE